MVGLCAYANPVIKDGPDALWIDLQYLGDSVDRLLAAVKKRGKLADIDDGNRPSILVNKKGARYGPFLL